MQLSGFSAYPDGSSSQLIGISGVLLHSTCLLCEYPVGQISSVAISTCIFAKTDRPKFCLSKEELVIQTKLPSIHNTFSTHWYYPCPSHLRNNSSLPILYILLFLFCHCVYFKRSVCSITTHKHSLLIYIHVTDVFFIVSTCTLSNMYVVSLRYVSRYIWNFRKKCIKWHTGNS